MPSPKPPTEPPADESAVSPGPKVGPAPTEGVSELPPPLATSGGVNLSAPSGVAPTASPGTPPAAARPRDDDGDHLPSLLTMNDLTLMAPPWLLSAALHIATLIFLALLFIPQQDFRDLILQLDSTEQLGDGLQDEEFNLSLDEIDFPSDDTAIAPQQFESADELLRQPTETPVTLLPMEDVAKPVSQPIRMALSGREKGMQRALLKAYGGTAGTQAAVMDGLRWLARNQQRDGLWSLTGDYSGGLRKNAENKEAATAMALIAFQGAGFTPRSGADEPFTKVVQRGWNRLLQRQQEEGNFYRTGPYASQLYTEAICTIALCELYGMTGDSAYRDPAQRAIDYCVRIQSPEGGWRYFPGQDSDTSVTGWFVMALQSARMAGLDVPDETLDRISGYLNTVAHDSGRRYAYQHRDAATPSMTAEGLLCRQYLGWAQDDYRLQEGADYLILPENLPSWESGKRDVYYWYYAAQVCHHLEGKHWRTWNETMRRVLPASQEQSGRERGSWDPRGVRWGTGGGRLAITCLSIYALEVYYRHLPIYKLKLLSGR